MTERVEGATFANETVRLDGRTFVSCAFDGCRIAYAGGPTELVGCTFTDCAWRLEGGAANTVALLGHLGASDGPSGQRLVDGSFSRLRPMRTEKTSPSDAVSTHEGLGVGAAAEVRIRDVTLRTRPEEAGEGAASATGETSGGAARRPARAGRWIFVSGDLAWIVIAAGVVLVTVVSGRSGG